MSNSVPQGWSLSTIGDTCDVLDSKRIPLNSQDRALRQGIYPYYGANGVQGYIDDFIFEGEHVLLAEDGGYFDEWDSRPISYLVTGRFWVNNHAHILKAKRGHETRYVHYSLVHTNILKHINGGTRAKLNQSDMREIAYLTPPLPEQKKIAAILSSVDNVIEKIRAKIDKLKHLKTGMMQELLTKGIGHTEFKDSPLGRIPSSWNVKSLGALSSFVTSGSRGWAQYYSSSGAIFIRIGNLTREHINLRFEDTVYVTPPASAEGKRTQVTIGDVLISITADLGVIGVVNESIGEAFVNQHISLVRLNEPALARWVGHFLAFENSQKQFIANNDAGAKAGLNLPAIRKTLVAIPAKDEREKIVASLDSVDQDVSLKRDRLQRLLNLKKALMQDLLTGKVRVKVDQKESAVA